MSSQILDHPGDDDSSASQYFAEAAAKTACHDSDDEPYSGGEDEDYEPSQGLASVLNNLFLKPDMKMAAAAQQQKKGSRSGAAVQLADVGGADQGEAEERKRMEKAVSKALAHVEVSHRKAQAELLNSKNTIKVRVYYPFRWSGKDVKGIEGLSADAPPKVVIDKKAADELVGKRIDFDNDNVFIRSTRIKGTSSTAPYPLALHINGIRSAETLATAHTIDGKPLTFVVHPGIHQYDEVVQELSDADVKLILSHGDIRVAEERKAVHPLDGDRAMIDPNMAFGRWAKQNEHLFAHESLPKSKDGAILKAMAPQLPLYLTTKRLANAGFKKFSREVLEALPSTSFLDHSASLTRFDRSKSSPLKFGDASDTAGLAPHLIDMNNKCTHAATICVEYEILNPATVAALMTTSEGQGAK